MPELPEVQAHADRLDVAFGGRELEAFRPLTFSVLKTAVPDPALAVGHPLLGVDRRGKYLLLRFEPVTFAVHLMQGGRLEPDGRLAARPRGGLARFVFADGPPALLLTEPGTERRAGVWCLPAGADDPPPLDVLGPEADQVGPEAFLALAHHRARRLHGFLRDQRVLAGLGRRLADEVCHRARRSPFTVTDRCTFDDAVAITEAIAEVVAEGLAAESGRTSMSSSKDRPARVHGRAGEPCPVCGDTIRVVEYRDRTVHYCPGCQTGGRILADNTTSRFLR